MIPIVLWLLCYFFSLKNDVTVPTKSNKQDADPLVRDTDPRIRIRIHAKMLRFRNTGAKVLDFGKRQLYGSGDGLDSDLDPERKWPPKWKNYFLKLCF